MAHVDEAVAVGVALARQKVDGGGEDLARRRFESEAAETTDAGDGGAASCAVQARPAAAALVIDAKVRTRSTAPTLSDLAEMSRAEDAALAEESVSALRV